MEHMRKAMYWSVAENESAQCGLCPHRCVVAKNAFGLCGARENRGGELLCSGYGRVSSMALDPIEKKPLYLFQPGKYVLSIGGFGCNLNCPFCQNHEISMVRQGEKQDCEPDPVTPEDIVTLALKTTARGNTGVAYTYNEPLIGYEFLYDCARLIHNAGLYNIVVTNGFINEEPLENLMPFIDAMNIDLKGFTNDFYRKLGGSLETVMETISRSHKSCHVEVTTLVIPGENEGDIEELAKWLSSISPDIPLHLSRFFPRFKYSGRKPTPEETIYRLSEIAKKHLKFVFAGNMR